MVVALGAALARQGEDVRAALARLQPVRVVASGLVLTLGVGLSSNVWRSVLGGLGHPIGVVAAAQVFFVGQLGKYLPGSVWPVVAQMELGRDHGLPPRVTAAAGLLFMWVHVVTGAAVAGTLLAASGTVPVWAGAAGICTLVLLAPGPLRWALGLAGRLSTRLRLPRSPDGRSLTRAAAWAAAMWGCYGMHLWLLADAAADAPGQVGIAVSAGAYAAAWVLGFVVVVVPAGAGVREAVLVAALPVGAGAGLAVAVVARVGTTLADAAWACAGLVAARRAGAERTRR